jgi:predicted enzyme related to lactoylglutathione lyase
LADNLAAMDQSLASGVSHIMLGVADMTRSLTFYEATLGRPVRFRVDDSLVFIDGGPVMIGLSTGLGKVRQPIAGAMELVFSVDSVTQASQQLRDKGIAVVREPRAATPQGDWTATFADPDGHYVTLFGPNEKTASTRTLRPTTPV